MPRPYEECYENIQLLTGERPAAEGGPYRGKRSPSPTRINQAWGTQSFVWYRHSCLLLFGCGLRPYEHRLLVDWRW
jgi:hypothetical protein